MEQIQKTYLFGLIRYNRAGIVTVTHLLGCEIYVRVGDVYSIFGMQF